MRLESYTNDDIKIFLNNMILQDIDWNNYEELTKTMKQIVLRLNNDYHLSLKGFYKVIIYLNEKIGSYLEIEKLEDVEFNNKYIDFKIVIYFKEDFFLEVNDYELLPIKENIYFYNNKFYINIESIPNEKLISLFEIGRIIYSKELDEIRGFFVKLS